MQSTIVRLKEPDKTPCPNCGDFIYLHSNGYSAEVLCIAYKDPDKQKPYYHFCNCTETKKQ